jgi:hypothetical protein
LKRSMQPFEVFHFFNQIIVVICQRCFCFHAFSYIHLLAIKVSIIRPILHHIDDSIKVLSL